MVTIRPNPASRIPGSTAWVVARIALTAPRSCWSTFSHVRVSGDGRASPLN